MISIFVKADDKSGEPLVADHYEFVAVPSVGDEVAVTDDRGTEHLLKVRGINHLSKPKGDVMNPLSYIHLICDRL